MRKKFIIPLCALFLVTICLSGCSKHTLKIDIEDVDKITFYPSEMSASHLQYRNDGVELNRQDLEEFIRLYNNAAYRGLELGYGTTSPWGCAITLKDGSIIELIAQCDSDFWVAHYQNGACIGGKYYIQSIEFDLFLTERADQLLNHPEIEVSN